MQLNDIIEENSLASISAKTRLSTENLEKLFRKDFQGFRKVQALGFISILEREYRVDLSDLRAQCLAYFDEGTHEEESHPAMEAHHNPPHKPTSVLDMSLEKKRSVPLKPVLVALAVIVLLYAAWQTYASGRDSVGNMETSQSQNTGFFSGIIDQAQSWIGGGSDNETAMITDGEAPASQKPAANKTEQAGDTFTLPSTPNTPASAASADQTAELPPKTNETPEETQSTADNAAPANPTEKTDTPSPTTDEMKQFGDALAAATEESDDSEDALATEVPSVAQSNDGTADEQSVIKEATQKALKDAAEAKARQEAAARKRAEEEAKRQAAAAAAKKRAAEKAARAKAAREKAAKEKAAKEKAAKKAGVVLVPRKKVWLGIVDLLTMKRSVKSGKEKVAFKNPDGGKWIVATGHGWVTLKMYGHDMKLDDGKKHFLLIQNGTVKEISHEKFQELNKSKVW